MSDPGKPVPLVGEAHSVHPPTAHGGVGELCHQLPDWHLLSPWRLAWTLLDVLDESGEHPDLEISGPACQEDVVGVPVQRGHSRLQRLLDVLCHPPKQLYYRLFLCLGRVSIIPVHSSFVIADGDNFSARADGKLVLLRRPADASGCPVDPGAHRFTHLSDVRF